MSGTQAQARVLHDLFLQAKPEGAAHDSETCPFCKTGSHEEAGVKTYSEEELAAAVQTAVAKATAEHADALAALQATAQKAEVDSAIEAATAELTTKVGELQSQLDTAVLEATAAKDELANLTSFLEEAKTAEETAAEVAARKETRTAKVAEVASFPEDYVTENAERWAEMADDEFDRQLADYAAITEKLAASAGGAPVKRSAMTAAADTKKTSSMSAVADVMSLRRQGIDPRRV